ncbi:FecR domain-containing protein [Candidatus Peregrinibacteria bacterium]|nr:FecR domain-containing protein [Candidatus Peregrinibacteria bacterium]
MDHLYYRRRRRRRRDMFMPFLILVCLLVIVVLIVQLFASMRVQTVENEKNQAFLFLEKGDTTFHPWGQDTWHDAYDRALILEGDTIKTLDGAYAVLEFYDGSRIRLNENTELSIEKLESTRKEIGVEVRMTSGEIWVNELETDDDLHFTVFTPHIKVTSVGTVYGVAVSDTEFVRVMRGEVRAFVMDTSIQDAELLESVSIGVGQQISLSQNDIDDLEARKFVSLLESLDDYWRVTEWNLWNVREDEDPTEYVVKEEVVDSVEAETEREELIEGEVEEGVLEEIAVDLPKITVTHPSESPYELTEDQIYLKGEATDDVTKVVVTEFYKDPQGVPYELSKFVPGSGIWNYSAGLSFGNLIQGKNRFVIQAFNGDGLISDPVEIVVNIGDLSPEEEVVEEEDSSEEASADADVEEAGEVDMQDPEGEPVGADVEEGSISEEADIVDIQEPIIPTKPISKTKPNITSVEFAEKVGENAYVTTENRVVVNGFTGGAADVQKVIVNGWPLSLYEVGSKNWAYYAKVAIGTIQPGDNTYNVYTENSKGERSLSMTFTIRKE